MVRVTQSGKMVLKPFRSLEAGLTGGVSARCGGVCNVHVIIAVSMGVLLQIRDVPDDVHRKLKARAVASGVSLSEYVRGVLERTALRPTPEELAARIAARGSVELSQPSETTVRQLREHGE